MPLVPPLPSPDECAEVPPCPDPPILGREPVGLLGGYCAPDGTPVFLVFAPGEADNAACPPVPGVPALPGYLGWATLAAPGVINAGAPPAGTRQCGERVWDHELICDVDPVTGETIALFSWVMSVDDSVSPPVFSWQSVTPGSGAPYAVVGVPRFCGADRPTLEAETWCVSNTSGTRRVVQAVKSIPADGSTPTLTFYDINPADGSLSPLLLVAGDSLSLGPCGCPKPVPVGVVADWSLLP